MAINNLHIRNFKGISEAKSLSLRPITIFVGPNSSGKSSCIHAIAALSQTVKLPNNDRPLILDDEYAAVHLGRFIEVLHSKDYKHTLSLGIRFPHVDFRFGQPGAASDFQRVSGSTRLTFGCSKRTQDISLSSARYHMGKTTFTAAANGDTISVSEGASDKKAMFILGGGFLLEPTIDAYQDFKPFLPLVIFQKAIERELKTTLYLGPFRQPPIRNYPTRGASPSEVGAQGEAAVTLLANEIIQTRSRPHIKQIARWLRVLGVGQDVAVRRVAGSDLFDVEIELSDGARLPIADLGYGISQALPVLVQCSFAPENSTLLFEQPEIHLHSLAARQLAKIFVETAQEKRATIIIETHSPELVKQFLTELREGRLRHEDLVLYQVRRREGAAQVTEIEVDEELDVYENWEKGLSSDY